MLKITMRPGEYFTVGGETVIQFTRLSGERAHLMIEAPREVQVLRGEVFERQGGQRPACVVPAEPYMRQLPWDGRKKRALLELRRAVEALGSSPEAQTVREQLEILFPTSFSTD